MSPKKQEVRLMFFSGFYESIHDSVFDFETEMIMEDYPDKEWEDFRFTYNWVEYSKSYVRAISSELGIDLEFQELISPREYNFTTDRIICYIKSKDVKKLATALNSPTFETLVRERFTSRDGFWSFYSRYVEDWKEKKITEWDAVELGTLLDAWIMESFPENNGDYSPLDYLDYNAFEYCQGNGQYVDYELLVEGKTQKQIVTEELEKLGIKQH